MANVVTPFDRLPQGTGYARPTVPDTDSAPDSVTSTQHVPDSLNDAMQMQVVSVPTTSMDAPTNPPPYWNSGEAETLKILE